jgi:hypothetical protein
VDRQRRALHEALSANGLPQPAMDATQLPEALVRATLAAEDARFYRIPASIRSESRGPCSTTCAPGGWSRAGPRSRSRR